jgi:hypothetical protein
MAAELLFAIALVAANGVFVASEFAIARLDRDPAEATMLTSPKLLEGRWLNPGDTGAIVLNQVAVDNSDIDIEVGDPVKLFINGHVTT